MGYGVTGFFGGDVGAVLTGVFATKAIGGVEGGIDQVKLQCFGADKKRKFQHCEY